MRKGNQNFVEILRERATDRTAQPAYSFISKRDEVLEITYKELDCRARAIAAQLQSVAEPGSRAILVYPPGLEFISAFFGCLYAGVVAVPVYPIPGARKERGLSRLLRIISNSGATVFLTESSLSNAYQPGALTDAKVELIHLTSDTICKESANDWRMPEIGDESLALLQYTSGTTSQPRGVKISHGNLWHNQRLIKSTFNHNDQTVVVSWLPFYHDMGLNGNILQPLFCGVRSVLMSPATFIQNPFRWLDAISKFGATTSMAPNFAYDLCVEKITEDEKPLLNLSKWRVAINGSEPVRAETLDRFARAFEYCGFSKNSFFPCYGLAESTLIVSGIRLRQSPVVKCFDYKALLANQVIEVNFSEESVRRYVSCGQVCDEMRLIIVDPESGAECANGHVGEIWVSGQSVAKGYWRASKEFDEMFNAYRAGNDCEPFLRTGDLGFLWYGEVFVTGRIKELIIVRGRKHYAKDIENSVELGRPGTRLNTAAAFSVLVENEERLVVVQEMDSRHGSEGEAREAFWAIQEAVTRDHEIQPYNIVFVVPASIPRTTSGKIQRNSCRELYLSGGLKILYQWFGFAKV